MASGEEGDYFQGDIKLKPNDDPYDLYQNVFKRMAFDGSGELDLEIDSLSARLWPNARIPYRFDSRLSECVSTLPLVMHIVVCVCVCVCQRCFSRCVCLHESFA